MEGSGFRAHEGRGNDTQGGTNPECACLAGGARGRQAHHDLDDLFGSLSSKDAKDLDKAIRDQRRIDPEQWR